MSVESMSPISAVIKYEVNVADGSGGFNTTWGVRIAVYKCRIYAGVGMMQFTPTGKNILTTHKCIGDYDSTIVTGDVLVDGLESYRIIQVDKVYAKDYIHHLEMRLQRENFNFG